MNSEAQDWATILYEASASGNPDVISLLLEYGADANIPKHTGHLPIHRVSHRGYVKYDAFLTLTEIYTQERYANSIIKAQTCLFLASLQGYFNHLLINNSFVWVNTSLSLGFNTVIWFERARSWSKLTFFCFQMLGVNMKLLILSA